ncbi:MAG: DUF3098 domain-containing protein [Saprospiraceae bacterium]|jgi:uncharacterized membrane protein
MAKKQQKKQAQPTTRKAPAAAQPRRSDKKNSIFSGEDRTLIFGRQNFIWMGAGLALVLIGLITMSGGSMDPNEPWGENPDIYSFRRITLAPILMLGGFVLAIVGIFKKSNDNQTESTEEENSAEA